MAAKLNIVIDQGSDFNTSFIVQNEDDSIIFSGYTSTAGLRKSYSSTRIYLFDTTLSNNGLVSLSMNANTTATIVAGRYVYEVDIENTAGNISRVAEGIVTVSPGIFANPYEILVTEETMLAHDATTYANVVTYAATLTSNNTLYLGGTLASGYQTTAGLSANVAVLTANNTTYFNAQTASYYTNASNITTGTLPYAQLGVNVVNTSANFTITGTHTYANGIIIANTITANSSNGVSGYLLKSSGASGSVYWGARQEGVKYLSGFYYSAPRFVITGGTFLDFSGNTTGNTITTNANTDLGTPIYLFPFIASSTANVSSIGLRTASPAGANCNAKFALWANDSTRMRPTGNPIGYNDTAISLGGANFNRSITLSVNAPIVEGSLYWLGMKASSNTTYCGFLSINNTSTEVVRLIGSAFGTSNNVPYGTSTAQISGIHTANVSSNASYIFSAAMSTTNISSSGVFWYTYNLGMPAMFFGIQ